MTEMLWDYPEDAPVHQRGDHHLSHQLVSWFHLFDKWVLRPHLMIPQVVLMDTWFYKYVARFMLKPEFFGTPVQSWFNGLTTPDIIFWFSTDPETAWHRKGKARETELRARGCNIQDERSRFIEYQTRVQESLGEIAECNRWRRINASPPIHEVTATAVDMILNTFAFTSYQNPILIDRANPDNPVSEGSSRS
jgi:thymidylate kinase